MNRRLLFGTMLVLFSASLICIGCAKTFLLSKDCKTYYFGDANETLYKMLCPSGDLQKVLTDSGLPEDTRASLYEAKCTDRSREKLDRIYASMSRDQQKALKSAFRKHGYEINVKDAPNLRYPFYDEVYFCPPE